MPDAVALRTAEFTRVGVAIVRQWRRQPVFRGSAANCTHGVWSSGKRPQPDQTAKQAGDDSVSTARTLQTPCGWLHEGRHSLGFTALTSGRNWLFFRAARATQCASALALSAAQAYASGAPALSDDRHSSRTGLLGTESSPLALLSWRPRGPWLRSGPIPVERSICPTAYPLILTAPHRR